MQVIHDGTDIQYFRPNVEWKNKDRLIVTYAARGLEPMRGIDIFVQLAKKICTFDERIQVYIIGDNKVNYGSNEIPSGGFGAWAQNELKDLCEKGKVIFKPRLNSKQYARLLKMSDLHFYGRPLYVAGRYSTLCHQAAILFVWTMEYVRR